MSDKVEAILKLFDDQDFIEKMMECDTDEKVIDILRVHGIEMTEADMQELQKALADQPGEDEFDEDTLELVSGGLRAPGANPKALAFLTKRIIKKRLRWYA